MDCEGDSGEDELCVLGFDEPWRYRHQHRQVKRGFNERKSLLHIRLNWLTNSVCYHAIPSAEVRQAGLDCRSRS